MNTSLSELAPYLPIFAAPYLIIRSLRWGQELLAIRKMVSNSPDHTTGPYQALQATHILINLGIAMGLVVLNQSWLFHGYVAGLGFKIAADMALIMTNLPPRKNVGLVALEFLSGAGLVYGAMWLADPSPSPLVITGVLIGANVFGIFSAGSSSSRSRWLVIAEKAATMLFALALASMLWAK